MSIKNTVQLVKWFVIVGAILFVGIKLFAAYEIHDLFTQAHVSFSFYNILLLVCIVCAMPVNILLEAMKWKHLISIYEKVSLRWSFQSTVTGIALGMITPNNIGDFAGRVMHLEKLNKYKGALIAVIGHTAQVMAVAIPGVLSILYLYRDVSWFSSYYPVVIGFCILLACITVALYIASGLYMSRFTFKKWVSYFEVFQKYSVRSLSYIALLSALRYIVFALQYVGLTFLFQCHMSFFESITAVAATLCAQIFIPSFLLAELGLRGASALYFMQHYSTNVVGILLSAYTLWIINIMVPAFFGLWSIYRLRIKLN